MRRPSQLSALLIAALWLLPSPAAAQVNGRLRLHAGVTCTGVMLTSATTAVNAAVQAQAAGTVFCFAPGTYLINATIEAKNNQQFICQPGAIFDGNGSITTAFHGTGGAGVQSGVTVSGCGFTDFTSTAIEMGWTWRVFNNDIFANESGISVNSYATVDYNQIYDNTQYGIIGGPGTDILILWNEIYNNNTSLYCGGACLGDAGGSKIVGSSAGTYNLIWRNNYVHDNLGPGIWSDGNVRALYEGNIVDRNSEVGIFHEISWDATIRYNSLEDNADDVAGMSCWWGSNIQLGTSSNAEVYGNSITANNGANGICITASDRPDATAPYPDGAENNHVYDNTIRMNTTGESGLVQAPGESYTGTSFESNDYYVDDDTQEYWTWPTDTSANWTAWRALGHDDVGGTLQEW